ncbi:MAG: single-stranded DNA-binding protein [Chloroflexi bacterium]|nr:single-stranded DNA-binding protein [Chloroflexota bacterium]
MGRGLNKVLLIGNLGRDPEMRYTPNGKAVTSFSLATSRSWLTSNGERREATEWFNVVSWGNLAEICSQYLQRGSKVYVEGRLQTRRWENAEGQPCYRTEVVANEMIILDSYPPSRGEDEKMKAEEDFSDYDMA